MVLPSESLQTLATQWIAKGCFGDLCSKGPLPPSLAATDAAAIAWMKAHRAFHRDAAAGVVGPLALPHATHVALHGVLMKMAEEEMLV